MFSILAAHKKIIIGVVVIVLLFAGYAIFMPKKSDTPTNLVRQNATGTTGTAADPNSPGRLFVSQLLAIQNIHFNLDLFADPAYLYLQDSSRELTPQDVGRQNPFAPLSANTGSTGTSVTESAGFINTSETATSTSKSKTPPKILPGSTSTSTRR